MHQDQQRRPVPRAAVLLALTALLLASAGCAGRTGRDPALSAKARSAIMSTCGGDMVEDVTADRSGLVRVVLNVAPRDAATARAVAKVTADIILAGTPEAKRVAVRDSAETPIETFSRGKARLKSGVPEGACAAGPDRAAARSIIIPR